MKKGGITVVSGFSGVGKGTLIKLLRSCFPDEYELSVSMTTRAPREGEKDGVDYHFITEEEFKGMIDRGEFLEHAPYVHNAYGTPKAPVEKWLSEGKNVLLEIELNGARQIRALYPDALLIFIVPPSADELEKRLVNRKTDGKDVIRDRLAKAVKESAGMEEYDYILVNDDRYDCMCQIHNLIKLQKQKPAAQSDFIAALREDIRKFQEE